MLSSYCFRSRRLARRALISASLVEFQYQCQAAIWLAASVLYFQEYGDFADYFGSLWHYYIGDIIAAIPVPFEFAKGQFESGLATKLLADFAADPFPYLDEAGKKKMTAVHADLLRKFTELEFDDAAAMRWEEAQPTEADNINVGPATEPEKENDLFEASGNPF